MPMRLSRKERSLKKLNNGIINLKKAYAFSKKHINYRMGSIAGLIGGGIVGWINWDYGLWQAGFAGVKQYFYNLFIAGYNVKTCEKLASCIDNRWLAYVAGICIPTAQAFAVVYAIHKFGNTPRPFDSTIWQVYVNAPTFAVLSRYYRKRRTSCKKYS